MLTEKQIHFLLELLRWEPVYEDRGVRLAKEVSGYREGDAGKLQAALSIMLEAKQRRGAP